MTQSLSCFDGLVSAVDGHGGHHVADLAKRHFFASFPWPDPVDGDASDLLLEGIPPTSLIRQHFLDFDEKLRVTNMFAHQGSTAVVMWLSTTAPDDWKLFVPAEEVSTEEVDNDEDDDNTTSKKKKKKTRPPQAAAAASAGGDNPPPPRRVVYARIAYVGDGVILQYAPDDPSRCSNNNLVEPHRPNSTDERNRIQAAGSFVAHDRVAGSLAVSRALANFQHKATSGKPAAEQAVCAVPTVIDLELRQGESIFLASDGFEDLISSVFPSRTASSSSAAATTLLPQESVREMIKRLVRVHQEQTAHTLDLRLRQDNATAFFIRIRSEDEKAPQRNAVTERGFLPGLHYPFALPPDASSDQQLQHNCDVLRFVHNLGRDGLTESHIMLQAAFETYKNARARLAGGVQAPAFDSLSDFFPEFLRLQRVATQEEMRRLRPTTKSASKPATAAAASDSKDSSSSSSSSSSSQGQPSSSARKRSRTVAGMDSQTQTSAVDDAAADDLASTLSSAPGHSSGVGDLQQAKRARHGSL